MLEHNPLNQFMMLTKKIPPKKYILGTAFVILLIGLKNCFVIINPNERGLVINLGKLQEHTLNEGIHFVLPFITRIKIFNLRINRTDLEATARTKELQRITTKTNVNWQVDPSKVKEIYLKIGNEDDIISKLITPTVDETIKILIPARTLEENFNQREKLKQEITIKANNFLLPYGIIVNDIALVNLTASDEFTKATEERQIARQNAITAQIVAEKQLKEAELKALKAKKEAEEMVNKAKGEAEAQKLLQQTLTPALLQKQAIEKWNGQYPTVMGNNGTLPMLNIAPPVVKPSNP